MLASKANGVARMLNVAVLAGLRWLSSFYLFYDGFRHGSLLVAFAAAFWLLWKLLTNDELFNGCLDRDFKQEAVLNLRRLMSQCLLT